MEMWENQPLKMGLFENRILGATTSGSPTPRALGCSLFVIE